MRSHAVYIDTNILFGVVWIGNLPVPSACASPEGEMLKRVLVVIIAVDAIAKAVKEALNFAEVFGCAVLFVGVVPSLTIFVANMPTNEVVSLAKENAHAPMPVLVCEAPRSELRGLAVDVATPVGHLSASLLGGRDVGIAGVPAWSIS